MPLKSNREWEKLAQVDPLYAIASVRGKRKSESKWTTEDFFQKGEAYMDLLKNGLSQIPPSARILEIGCGAGRITRALASRYQAVLGIDVAPTMIELAKKMCKDIPNAEFKVGEGVLLPTLDQSVDAVVSIQVLQHVDRNAMAKILLECQRILRPNGLIVLHIPAPSIAFTLRPWLTLAPIRRIITSFALIIKPNLDVSRKGWVQRSQYNTYNNLFISKTLQEIGFKNIKSFMFRPGKPFSTVYVATA